MPALVFGSFALNLFPCVGCSWFKLASDQPARLVDVVPDNCYSLAIVRHPADWLLSIYNQRVIKRFFDNPHLNKIIHYSALSGGSFEKLVDLVTEVPGIITDAFNYGNADSAIRLEHFPYSASEFLDIMLGANPVRTKRMNQYLPTNVYPGTRTISRDLQRKIVQAEREFCDKYDYF